MSNAICDMIVIKAECRSTREASCVAWFTKMGFAPPIRRDVLWALSGDLIGKTWPCDSTKELVERIKSTTQAEYY